MHRHILRALLFLTGLLLSSIAAFYSVTGLAHIFSGALVPVMVMGSALELAKLVGASWVFRHWRAAPKMLTAYVSVGILVLMMLTGVGIFGYLSRAYLVQQAPLAAAAAERTTLERAVTLAKDAYTRDENALETFSSKNAGDQIIARLTERDRLSGNSGAVNVLRSQQTLQRELQTRARESAKELQVAEQALAVFNQRTQEQTVDIGPLLFIAKAWYRDTSVDVLDRTVTIFILVIISVFDPMAIALLLAAQSLAREPVGLTNEPDKVDNTSPNIDNTSPNIDNTPELTLTPAVPDPSALYVVTRIPPNTANTVVPESNSVISSATDTSTLADPVLSAPLPIERPKHARARRVRSAEAHRLSHS